MSIIYFLLLLLLLALFVVFWLVTTSCAVAWYEYANREPELIDARFLPDRQWLAFRLMLIEAGALCLSLLLHPFGFLPQRPSRPIPTQSRPVVLLHGLFHNRAVWWLLKRRLEQCGFPVITVNLPPWENLDRLLRKVEETVEEALSVYNVDRVHLVGHSLGGVLARYYVQLGDGAQKVDKCVLIATPNAGSKLAPFALSTYGRMLIPGSDFLAEIAAVPLPATVCWTSIYSLHDNIVIPSESASLKGAENLELDWLGHVSLLFHPDAHAVVVEALRTP